MLLLFTEAQKIFKLLIYLDSLIMSIKSQSSLNIRLVYWEKR